MYMSQEFARICDIRSDDNYDEDNDVQLVERLSSTYVKGCCVCRVHAGYQISGDSSNGNFCREVVT